MILPVMAVWAMRDLSRKSGRSILLFVALCTLVCVVATPLLLTDTLALSSEILLKQGPSLVIRRVTAGGWATLPVENSIKRIEAVPGVLDARTRIWGVSSVNGSPVTLIGVEKKKRAAIVSHPVFQLRLFPVRVWLVWGRVFQWVISWNLEQRRSEV